MKLRIKDDSVRFRVAPSEVRVLASEGRLSSHVRFSLHPDRSLAYSLVLDEHLKRITVGFSGSEVIARLPKADAVAWAYAPDVSLVGRVDLDDSSFLTVLIEKDFACLDLSDEENTDTYPNPNSEQRC